MLPTLFSCRKIRISGGLLTSREPCQGFCSHAFVRKHSLEHIGDPAEAAGAITVPGASRQGELRWEEASQDRGKPHHSLGVTRSTCCQGGDTPWPNEETAKPRDGQKGGWLARGTTKEGMQSYLSCGSGWGQWNWVSQSHLGQLRVTAGGPGELQDAGRMWVGRRRKCSSPARSWKLRFNFHM